MLLDFLKKITNGDGSSSWKLTYDRFKPAQESLRETLCTLGNGYFATRGAAIESCASRVHYPGTYMAGVYNKLATHISGRTIHNDDLVNCPNWMLLTFRVGKGEWVTPSTSKLISFYQELDIRKGILFRRMRVQDKLDQVTLIESKVMVHMADPHRGVIKYVITPENYDGWIVVRSALDGTVENKGVARYGQLNSKHFKANSLGSFSKNGIFCSVETSQSKIEIALASKIHIFSSGKEIKYANRVLTQDKKGICEEFGVYLRRNRKYEIEKTVCIYTSRDKDVRSPLKSAIKCVRSAHRFDMLLKTHKQAWDVLWKKFDIQIEGDDFAQKVVRLHIFHLLQTASIHNFDIDAGLPARGLTGEAYRGHIFWDEMYVMPFFDLHSPDISKSLLMYRHRRLHQARKYAKKSGYKGSMFPWQSSATGDEETQIIHLNPMSGKWGPDNSRIQRHVSFAIAYNVWQLWKRTGDVNFISKYGAEMMLSIAQFGASLSKYNARDGRYHSEGVMGPDEFHEKLPGRTKAGFRDNAYTNILIVWTLLRAKEILESVSKQSKRRLLKKLNITEKELSRWDDISHKMKIIFNEEGVISQFDGYFDLQELNWNAYRLRYGNIQRMDRILKTEGKSPNDYKVSKQADVLMIFYLLPLSEIRSIFQRLGYKFNKNILNKNYEYYVKRTSHGSTLSKVVHCFLAHLLDRPNESWQWFMEVLKSDIYDTQGGTTPEGIHCGVMGGSLDIVVRGFAGVKILPDKLKIDPNLPRNWKSVKFKFRHKRNWISIALDTRHISILIHGQKAKPFKLPVEVSGKRYYLHCGQPQKISLKKGGKVVKWGGSLKMAQERILIVDGDLTLSEILEDRLEAMGYLVDCARNGNQALDVLKNKWVDLIIMAISLQDGMNGFQFFKEIKSRNEYKNIPIVVQSSKTAMRRTFEILGAQAFFAKPYDVDLMLQEIKRYFGEEDVDSG